MEPTFFFVHCRMSNRRKQQIGLTVYLRQIFQFIWAQFFIQYFESNALLLWTIYIRVHSIRFVCFLLRQRDSQKNTSRWRITIFSLILLSAQNTNNYILLRKAYLAQLVVFSLIQCCPMTICSSMVVIVW